MLSYFEKILESHCCCCKKEITQVKQKDLEDKETVGLKDILLIIICGDWNEVLDSITICRICKKSMKSYFIGFFLRGMFAGLVVAISIIVGIKVGAL